MRCNNELEKRVDQLEKDRDSLVLLYEAVLSELKQKPIYKCRKHNFPIDEYFNCHLCRDERSQNRLIGEVNELA